MVIWICVVDAFSFSLGTARLSRYPSPDGISFGNSSAWANALGANARTATSTPAYAAARRMDMRFMSFSLSWRGLRDGERGWPAGAHGACEQRRPRHRLPGAERLRPLRGPRLQQATQDLHDRASPRERVAQRTEQCGGGEREGEQDRDRVSVHRPLEA